MISANFLSICSIYGATAELCDEVSKRIGTREKPTAPEHLEKVKIPSVLSARQKIPPMHSSGGTCGRNTSENSSNCQKTKNYTNGVLVRL